MNPNSVPHARTSHARLPPVVKWVRRYTRHIGKIPTWQFIFHIPLILVLLIVSIIINLFNKENK